MRDGKGRYGHTRPRSDRLPAYPEEISVMPPPDPEEASENLLYGPHPGDVLPVKRPVVPHDTDEERVG